MFRLADIPYTFQVRLVKLLGTKKGSFYIILLLAPLISACTVFYTPMPPKPTPIATIPTLSPTQLSTNITILSPTTILPPTTTSVPTTAPIPNMVRFAVIGDYGLAGGLLEAVATLVKSWNPDLIITVGDNNYPDGEAKTIDKNIGQYFQDYIHPYQGDYGEGADINRFFPSLGDHDWRMPNARPYLDYFTLPNNERYYDFVWGPVNFFALDSDEHEPEGVDQSSIQAQWLQSALAASTAPWKIVYFHHPPFSSTFRGPVDWMRWPFQEWGASVVISGHEHVYERFLINDFPYIINGLGGQPSRYNFRFPREGSEVRYRSGHGAILVEASEAQITFEFITIKGELIDTYTLERIPAGTSAANGTVPQNVITFPDSADYQWQPITRGFNKPLLVTHAGDGSERLFVVEQPGVIQIVQDEARLASPFLDIRTRVSAEATEQGLLGLAFHPNYPNNGYFYVNYTNSPSNTVIARYQVSPQDPNKADPGSELRLLDVQQPFINHNGGHLAFGPDGYLYIGLGDGGAAYDPEGNAQNLGTLLGTLLRLDVDSATPYAIPADNPFVNGNGRPEIWAYGLRNPWRFSFDRLTGDLYIGDVGQNIWEEIDFIPTGSPGGVNFGWDYLEGTHPLEGSPQAGLTMVSPISEYSHAEGGCSVTGGVVYRGQALPQWQGIYLYGDYCSGLVWGLLRDADENWQHALLFDLDALITSFGEDEAGEVYLVARQGVVFRLAEVGQ